LCSLTVEPNEPLLISSLGHNLQVSQEVWAFLQRNGFVWTGAKVKPLSDIPYPHAFCPFEASSQQTVTRLLARCFKLSAT
jgi:hypothetical protein